MHISEGVLSAPVLVSGAVVSAGFIAAGFRKMQGDRLTKTALLSSLFFIGSFIHVPIGPSSVHLLLNGIIGAVLGVGAFPAIFVALIFQALLFQFGGLTSLGVNTFNAAFPAIAAYFLFRYSVRTSGLTRQIMFFITGFVPVVITCLLVAFSLFLSGEELFQAASAIFIAHIPVMVIEGIASVFIFQFILKVYPEFLKD